MPEARTAILSRLRQSPPAARPVPPPPPAAPRGWTQEERLARFTACQEAVKGEVHRTTRADWPTLLRRLLAARSVQTLACGAGSMPQAALDAAWQGEAEAPSLIPLAPPLEAWKAGLFGVEAGLTTSRAAIAATGSLILWPDAQEPRLLSLVPPIHIALLEAHRLYETFDEVLAAEGWAAAGLPTNALLISGPSKTADIEQTLAYGVHGPKELIVLVLEN